MIGDILLFNDYHHVGTELIIDFLKKLDIKIPYSLSVSGESGSGKTEIAQLLKEKLEEQGKRVMVLGQDDYFRLPPHSNHQQRKIDINWVGPMEVQLIWMNYNVQKLVQPEGTIVFKPLIHFTEDKIDTEYVTGPYDIVIAEGTYTALLGDIDVRIFINRDYKETKKHRLSRNRDQALENDSDHDLTFLEKILQIEHRIIKKHIKKADLVIPPPDVLLEDKKIS